MPCPAPNRIAPGRPHGEQGYILLAVVFLTVMVLIALSVAAPKMARSIERDREVELMHRGKQFQRAIQLYYRKFGAFPPTMDALEKSNNIRFLRKRYKDPITGKDEWQLIHFGEAKTRTLGFFGQPLAGTGTAGGSLMAGIGPSGGNQTGGPLFGGSPITNPSGSGDATATNGSSGNTDVNGNPINLDGSPATPQQQDGTATATPNQTASTFGQSGSSTGSSFGSGGQTFGGAGIIGVKSTSTKLAILEYKKKKHFNEWEFVYDPLADRVTIGNNLGGSATGNSSGSGLMGNGGFNSGTSGGFGSGSGIGNNPVQPPSQQQ
jgi:type II secretory pathway pseudopilin PulG